MKYELPVTVRIKRVIEEARGIKSFLLPCRLAAKPGQFCMIWLPGIDAKPIGISYQTKEHIGVTVCAVGPWSKKVCQLKEGDLLGVLGPYGNAFQLEGKSIVLVGGGYGAASLMLLAEEARSQKLTTTMIIGAKTEAQLLYRQRVASLSLNTIFTTDDGSFGQRGTTTDALAPILKTQKVDSVYVCGPELMEKKVAELCRDSGVRSFISLERQMKCGFGVCGACSLDDSGKRVCVEGTIFPGEEVLQIKEFGQYHRDSSATKHHF
ncbi:MAG: dihydroorotate dehydrogenase electron transfer subunit [Elusimicrobia bacterium]|nr:dihydroorotate dehydrogenase electron transfer subunit [Candidatus Obscuribacterium magneticum]